MKHVFLTLAQLPAGFPTRRLPLFMDPLTGSIIGGYVHIRVVGAWAIGRWVWCIARA